MNIIFLNNNRFQIAQNRQTKRPYSGYEYPFDVRCMYNLKHLVDVTNSYLVITSTWRKDEIGRNILLAELEKYGLSERVIGYTSILHKPRGEEVKDYLANLGTDVNYIIIDDDSDFEGLEEHLIKTSFMHGFNEENTDECIKKLTKE